MTRPVQCIDEQELGDVLALPQSDPQRRHVDECPRCRALAVSYRDFLDPASEEALSYGSAEDRQLTEFRERLTGSAPTPDPAVRDAQARAAGPASPLGS